MFASCKYAEIDGIQFFDASGNMILQAGIVKNCDLKKEFTLT